MFRTNGVLQIAIIAVAVVAIWLRWFIWPAEMVDETGSGPVYDLMRMVLGGVPVAATAVALGLTLAEGYVLNRMLYEKGLVPLNSLMPMLLYVIYLAIGCRGMSPVVVANLWVLLGLWGRLQFLEVLYRLDLAWVFWGAVLLVVNRYFCMRIFWEKTTRLRAILGVEIYDKMFPAMAPVESLSPL